MSSPSPSLRSRFLVWVIAVGATVAILLTTLGIQVNRGFDENSALRNEVIRSYRTRAELQTILSLHQDMETGQRGYVLTGNPQFLEPYAVASDELDSALTRLSHHIGRDDELSGNLAGLRASSRLKRDFLSRTIEMTTARQASRARDEVAGGEGKRLMDRIRAYLARLDAAEAAQLDRQTEIARDAQNRLQKRIIALQIVLIGMLLIALGFLIRTYRGWQVALSRERDLGARQEAIFDSARDGMIIINPSGSIESLNPSASRMFGYEPDQLLRRDIGVLFEIAPDRGLVETFLKRLSARRSAGGDIQEFTGRCRDGSLIPVEVSVSPVALSGGSRFLAVLRDITERRQVDQMKTEFVSTVSHELRTPLTSISGSLGLIAGGAAGDLPASAKRLVEIARSNCARLIRLINDILDIEKIESGRMAFTVQPLELGKIIPQAIEAMDAYAEAHQVSIELEPVPANAVVLGDEDRVIQILTNLLSNAARYSPENEAVRVSVTPLDRRYRISVADRGPGIDIEFRDRIFGKFAQADSSDTRQKGGTGLGLNIVREIAERLGGAVSFDSVPGEGATFHVDLPIADGANPPSAARQIDNSVAAAKDLKVLHVDDDPDMLRIVAGVFEGRATVRSVPTIQQARIALRDQALDAVILDLGMADGDGADLIPLVRQRCEAPIIVFTAQDADPEFATEVDAILVKSRDSLDRLVDEVLRLAGIKKGHRST